MDISVGLPSRSESHRTRLGYFGANLALGHFLSKPKRSKSQSIPRYSSNVTSFSVSAFSGLIAK